MKKVRILAQYLYFYPRFGGIENHMYYLYKNLAKKGNQITVITSKNMANQPEQENIDGINIIRKGTSGLKNIGKRNYFGWLVDLISSFPILLRKAKKSDILHAHTFFFALPMGIAKRIYKKKLITTLHTVEFLQLAKSFFGRLFLYFFIRNSDLILATSVETKILCEKVINRPIVSIVNGIDTNLFKPVKPAIKKSSKDKVILLCARRLVPKNGIKYLIEAMPLIRKNIDAKLYIIGDGIERSNLQNIANKKSVSSFVHFMGPIANNELPRFYSSADAVIIPSLYEGTSLAALEAMACKVPVAASNIGGLPEIVTDKTGILFKAKNPKDTAEKIICLLKDKDYKNKKERARKMVADNWSINNLVKLHEKIYSELMENEKKNICSEN